MSRLLATAARVAWDWFEELHGQGIDLTTNAHIKVEKEAIEFADEPSLEEAADVIIAVLGACYHRGWTRHDIAVAMIQKLTVNRNRKWERQTDGTYQHVPGT